jgi:hypothetical protein
MPGLCVWRPFIRFGPDGKLYIPIGVPCNICEALLISDDYANAVYRISYR